MVPQLLRWPAAVFAGLAAAALAAGCASPVEVRRMATDSTPAYELHGPTLAALADQAAALCPRGFAAIQQWEHRRETPPDASAVARWTADARGWVGLGEGSASMTVQCKA